MKAVDRQLLSNAGKQVHRALRHLEVCSELRQFQCIGMYEEKEEGDMLSEAQRINVKVGKV